MHKQQTITNVRQTAHNLQFTTQNKCQQWRCWYSVSAMMMENHRYYYWMRRCVSHSDGWNDYWNLKYMLYRCWKCRFSYKVLSLKINYILMPGHEHNEKKQMIGKMRERKRERDTNTLLVQTFICGPFDWNRTTIQISLFWPIQWNPIGK